MKIIFFEHTPFEKKTIVNFYLLELRTVGGNGKKCSVCKKATAIVKGMAERKEKPDKIKKKFCHVVSIKDPKKCKAKVAELAAKMLISKDASPEMICQAIGFCKVKG